MALPLPSASEFPHHVLPPSTHRIRPPRASMALGAPEKKTRKKRQTKEDSSSSYSSSVSTSSSQVSVLEKSLRFTFMEELMLSARAGDAKAVSEVIYDMIAAGLNPGPRSFHGLIVAQTLSGDHEGAMQSLRRELSAGIRPTHETFIALIRLFGSKGYATRGLEILAAMEKLKFDIRQAWLVLVEELVRNKYLDDANQVFLKGAEGGLRATDQLYDLLIEEDCKAGDHSNALTIAYEMEAAGRMANTFHFNCLLSVQATCGIPEIAFTTFENMEFGGEEFMKPDTQSYNWVIQAYTRAESYDRVQDVAELLGMMVEAHKHIQPNVKTYALLVECFTKYCVVREAIRHFRALKNFDGWAAVLHNEGKFGDPLSLYLRALCREGRPVQLLEALEAMAKENQSIPPRAMILNKKYRSLVSSWIEPLHEEADLGYEIDYVARYIEEGGLTGQRMRWVPRRGKAALDPDAQGFAYSNPIETSFKQRCLEDWKTHHKKLLRILKNEGPAILGEVSHYDLVRVEERLRKIIKGPEQSSLKPKAASKMIVSELKEELEAQGLPTDGTRQVLYQRVQKARRINRSRGRPLWVPPVEQEEEDVDEELDELISRIKWEDGNTEFWRHRFLEEGQNEVQQKLPESEETEIIDILDYNDVDVAEDGPKEPEDEEAEEEEEVEQPENQAEVAVKEKDAGRSKPLQMIGVQLLKDAEQAPSTTNKSKGKMTKASFGDDDDDDWFPEDVHEAFKEMRHRRVFDVSDMYTIADAWGWTWERELKQRAPQKWSQEWEVDLAVKILDKVVMLGGKPTIGDCAMILRAAIRAPAPSSFLGILQKTHSLGYVFGSPLYDEVISLCLDLGEHDAAIAIVTDMETTGIKVPAETLDQILAAKQASDSSSSSDNLSLP